MDEAKFMALLEQLDSAILQDITARSEVYPVDLFSPELNEAVCSLIARIGTLASQLLRSPNTWNQHSAPLFHRAMSDAHITLAYILESNSAERAREYIRYGLGQEKLAIAHLEAKLDEDGEDKNLRLMIDVRREWLVSQRYEQITEVNLGSHTGKSTRQMAELSGNLDLYNYNFTIFSACVHSTWQHVGRYNAVKCTNPLHGGHFVGVMGETDDGFHDPHLALRNLREVLELVDEFMKVELPIESWRALQKLLKVSGEAE